MAENKSSASTESIMPGNKFTSSTISDNAKSGDMGSDPISTKSMDASRETNRETMTETFDSKNGMSDTIGDEPVSKPSSTFINTSAVKKG